jgi:hypothetical protein
MDKICRGSHIGKSLSVPGLHAGQDVKAAGMPNSNDGRLLALGASVPKLRIPRRSHPKEHAIHPATARLQALGSKLDLALKSRGAITQRSDGPGNQPARRRFCESQKRPMPVPVEATLRMHEHMYAALVISPCSSAQHRSPSPTFVNSEDWMSHDERQHERTMSEGCSGRPSIPNFTARLRRMHSGKMTENSENWLHLDCEDATPATSTIANGFDFLPSRGKRMNYEKDNAMQRRLRLDSETEQEPYRVQRRHDFPSPVGKVRIEKGQGIQRCRSCSPETLQQLQQRHQQGLGRQRSVPTLGTEASILVVDAQHRTSEEMALSIMPDTPPCDSGSAVGQPKFLMGNELITWESTGRRGANSCMKHGLQSSGGRGSLSQKARSMVNLRDHRNSDDVRDQLNPDGVAGGAGCRGPPPQSRIQCFGEISHLPSSMQKDSAYMHSGVSNHRYTKRSPGVFSPNVTRVPILHVSKTA